MDKARAPKNSHEESASKETASSLHDAAEHLSSATASQDSCKRNTKVQISKSDTQPIINEGLKNPLPPLEISRVKAEIHLDGILSSPDKKKTLKVVQNEIFDHHDKKLATLDPTKGKVIFTEDSKQQSKDLNSYLNYWKFVGKENGKYERILVTSSSMSNGRAMLAESGNAERRKCDIRMGMLIDSKTGEQLGTITPPSENHGEYKGGSIIFKNGKESTLEALVGSSYEFELMGQTGKHGRPIRIYATDKAQERLVDLNKFSDDARCKRNIAGNAYAEEASKTYFDLSKYYDAMSGRREELKKVSDDASKTLKETEELIEQLLTAETTKTLLDPSRDIYDELKIKNKALKEAQITKSNESKLLSVMELNSEKLTNKVNAKLRIGNDLFEIRRGDLFRITEDSSGLVKRESTSCGELKPGYKILFKDGRNIDLHSENRVLLDMQIEGEAGRHQIIGLGSARKAEDGSVIPGGLVDRRALIQEAELAAAEAKKGNITYFEGKPIITGEVTDYLAGGRQDILDNMQKSIGMQVQAIDKELNQLFTDESFRTGVFDNNRIDQNLRATSNFMRDLNLSAQESQQLAADGLQLQRSASEGATIAVTSLATMGVGTVVNGFVNAGKLGAMTGVGIELAGGAVAGGTSSAIMRYTRADDTVQVRQNFVGGMFEGATMFVGGRVAHAFGELKSVVRAQRLARELEIINGTGAATAGGKLINAMASSITAESMITGAVKLGNAGLQTAGFSFAGAARQKDGNWGDYLSTGKSATGTLWFLTGDLVGTMMGRGISALNTAAEGSRRTWLATIGREQAKDSIVSRQISSMPTTTTTMFTFSSLAAIESAYDAERKQISKELNKPEDKIGFSEVWKHADKEAVFKEALSQGASAAIFSPIVSLGHGGIEAFEKRFGSKPSGINLLKSEISDFYQPKPEEIAQQAESAGKVMHGDLSKESARWQFSNDVSLSIENLLKAGRPGREAERFIDSTKDSTHTMNAVREEAAVLEGKLNQFLKNMKLPPVKLQVKDLSDLGVIRAYYEDGIVTLNSKQLRDTSVSELRALLYHELTHHDQAILVIKRILDQENIGKTVGPDHISELRAKCNELTKRLDGKEEGLRVSEEMIAQVVELRKGERLSKADAKRADKLVSDFRNYVEIPELYKLANEKHDATYKENERLQDKPLNEFLSNMDSTLDNKHWWGAETSSEIKARVAEFKEVLAKMPVEKARKFLSEVLKQRSNEVNAEWKSAFNKYMQMPELEAYSNQLAIEALSTEAEKMKPNLDIIFEDAPIQHPQGGPSKGIYSYTIENLNPNEISLKKYSPSVYLNEDSYYRKLGDLKEQIEQNSNGSVNQSVISQTAKMIREGMERDIYTLPLDKLKTEEQKLALGWHVLWESLQENRTDLHDPLERCNVKADEISYALLALTAGRPVSKYPDLVSVLQKLCPYGIPTMFKVPLKPMTKGKRDKGIVFPVALDTIDHHFKVDSAAGRVMDPQHIYKSHLVWSFLNGNLPEGMLVTEFEKLGGVGGSYRPGYKYTLDYEPSIRIMPDGSPVKHRNPITIIIEEMDSPSGTYWIYKTHYEKSSSYRRPLAAA